MHIQCLGSGRHRWGRMKSLPRHCSLVLSICLSCAPEAERTLQEISFPPGPLKMSKEQASSLRFRILDGIFLPQPSPIPALHLRGSFIPPLSLIRCGWDVWWCSEGGMKDGCYWKKNKNLLRRCLRNLKWQKFDNLALYSPLR